MIKLKMAKVQKIRNYKLSKVLLRIKKLLPTTSGTVMVIGVTEIAMRCLEKLDRAARK